MTPIKIAWTVLLVSAITDFVINAGTALGTAMVATGNTAVPSKAVVLLALIGGLVAAMRTIQQGLKALLKYAGIQLPGDDSQKETK